MHQNKIAENKTKQNPLSFQRKKAEKLNNKETNLGSSDGTRCLVKQMTNNGNKQSSCNKFDLIVQQTYIAIAHAMQECFYAW